MVTLASLVVGLAVGHLKKDGTTRTKIFRPTPLTLGPHERRDFARTHGFHSITTRVYYPGTHQVGVALAGQVLASVPVELLAPRKRLTR